MKKSILFFFILVLAQQALLAQFGPRQFIGDDNKSYAYEDIDSDGDIDIIVGYGSGDYIAVRYNNGTGNFANPVTIIDSPESPKWIIADDIDSDGDVDLVYVSDDFGSSNDNLMVALWSGTEYIQTAYNFPDLLNKRIYVADLNGDGHDEVIASDATASNANMYIYHNNGDGSLQTFSLQPWTVSGGVQGNGVLDIEDDNDEDFIFAPGSGNNLFVLKHIEGSTYERDTIANVGNIDSIAILDYDEDGDEDIIYAGFDLKYIENMGGGNFEAAGNVLNTSTTMGRVVAGDLDGDGDLDLLTSRSGTDALRANFNLGGGNFVLGNVWEYLGETHYVTHARDMNNDGLADLISDEDIDDNYYRINEYDFCFSLGASINTSNDRIICPGEETTIFASSSADLTWVGLGDENSYVVSPEETTVYNVEGTDDNDCFVNSSTMVTVLPTPSLELPMNIEICSGEPIELTASSDGTIQWVGFPDGTSISIAPEEDTTFIATATNDDGCETEGEVLVSVLEEAYPLFEVSEDQEICLGDTVLLVAFSDNSTLIWEADPSSDSLFVQPTEDSFFAVTAMNGDQCSITDSVLVAVNEASQVELELSGTSLESVGTYVAYEWFFNGVLIESEESSTLELNEDGVYTVVAFDAIGCSTTAEYDYVFIGLEEIGNKVELSVYPNPMNNNALVSYSGSELPKELFLSDGQARKIKTLSVSSQQGTWLIERNGLASGLYFVNVLYENGHQDCIRVIVH